MKTGKLGSGDQSHTRWCNPCKQWHGILYICPSYPKNLKNQLLIDDERFKSSLSNPTWIKENDVTPVELAILKLFIGE